MSKFNPFNPNSVVVPNLFAGRTEQLDDICKKLSQLKHYMPASFFLYGERGIGKTALAKLVKYIATEDIKDFYNLKLLTAYYSVEKNQDIESVLQESLNKLTEDMDQNLIEKIGKRVGSIFKNGKFEIGAFGVSVGMEKQDEKKRQISIKDQAVSILSNIIKSVNEEDGEDTENKRDGVLIIIDEMHNLKDIVGTSSIIRNIITTLDVDNLGNISFLLIGYEEDLKRFFLEDSSARRTFDSIQLDVMPKDEAAAVLEKGFERAEKDFDKEALKENIGIAGGYPHSIQIIGHQLIEADSDNNIDQEDWDKAMVDAAIKLQSKEFSDMYSFNKPLTIADEILILLAERKAPMFRKEIAKNLEKKNIYQYLAKLKKVGAIKEDSGKKVHLQSQLLRTAILIDQYIREKNVSNINSNYKDN